MLYGLTLALRSSISRSVTFYPRPAARLLSGCNLAAHQSRCTAAPRGGDLIPDQSAQIVLGTAAPTCSLIGRLTVGHYILLFSAGAEYQN